MAKGDQLEIRETETVLMARRLFFGSVRKKQEPEGRCRSYLLASSFFVACFIEISCVLGKKSQCEICTDSFKHIA